MSSRCRETIGSAKSKSISISKSNLQMPFVYPQMPGVRFRAHEFSSIIEPFFLLIDLFGLHPGCDQGNSASSASHARGQQRDILRKEKLDLGKRIREALRMAEVGKGFGGVKEACSQEGVGLNVGWAHTEICDDFSFSTETTCVLPSRGIKRHKCTTYSEVLGQVSMWCSSCSKGPPPVCSCCRTARPVGT